MEGLKPKNMYISLRMQMSIHYRISLYTGTCFSSWVPIWVNFRRNVCFCCYKNVFAFINRLIISIAFIASNCIDGMLFVGSMPPWRNWRASWRKSTKRRARKGRSSTLRLCSLTRVPHSTGCEKSAPRVLGVKVLMILLHWRQSVSRSEIILTLPSHPHVWDLWEEDQEDHPGWGDAHINWFTSGL